MLIVFAMHNQTANQFVGMKGGIQCKVDSGCQPWSGEDNKVGIANEL